MPETAEPEVQFEISYPEALCRGNWMVLFENGDVVPVKYFLDEHGRQLTTSRRAASVIVDGPFDKRFVLKLDDVPVMSLH